MILRLLICAMLLMLTSAAATRADEPPTIPVGLDAYRQWDKWPLQRIGARAYMRSTYDRAGGNEGADASHFLYQLADDQNVALDVQGPGVLYFTRYNQWHGSPWRYSVDGVEHIVQDSSTKDPLHPVENSTFDPAAAFPPPLAYTWSATRGADLSWVPIEFEKSLRLAFSRTHYGTGYFIYQQYVPGAQLSHPLQSWHADPIADDDDVLGLLRHSGDDIAPAGVDNRTDARSAVELRGPAVIRALKLNLPAGVSADRLRLRVTWDGRGEPSIDAPLALFFGAGTLYNRDNREFLVRAFPMNVRFAAGRIELACYFPMPFFKSAKLELTGLPDDLAGSYWQIRTQPLDVPPSHVGYFHATYRDHPAPEPGKDLILLDTRNIEGSRDWTGLFVGTSFIFSHNANLTTLEGDPRFFFDDSESPQGQGTGTEEWGGGGDYWGGQNMTLPFAGHPCGARSLKDAKCEEDKIESAYRFLLADLFPFGKNARICLEHGGTNESSEHYETVTYWYGSPGASVVKTDELNVGETASEKDHDYLSPEASLAYTIESRYNWGVDHLKDRDIYPAHRGTGRTTTGTSQFTLKLDPDNWGVMLRRTLDYHFANQRAEVSVKRDGRWVRAGVWYTAGSSTCVYSNPKDELGATQHMVQTSNRRFRDDEFLIGRELTRRRDSIDVRVKFTPVRTLLIPGGDVSTVAWSEMRYAPYCFVMPK